MTSHKDSYIGRMYQFFMVNSRKDSQFIHLHKLNWFSFALKRVVPSFYFSTPCYEGRSVPKKSCHSVLHINSSRWNKDGFKPKKSVRKKVFIFMSPVCRDSGNDFRVPEIGLDNSCFSFILFLYPHVVPSRFSNRLSFLGADFHFWSWLVLTRNKVVSFWISEKQETTKVVSTISACVKRREKCLNAE